MKDIIKTILYEWQERELPEVLEREFSFSDYLKLKIRKIIVVTGFRRTGKTYLIFKLIQKLLAKEKRENILYINFEDERIPEKTEFLTQLLPTIKETFGKAPKFLFLDEIQNIPHWSKWLRRVYDKEKINFFVTGSSSKMSSREIPTELRGRCLEIKIFPLSFSEFLNFKNLKINLKSIQYSENQRVKIIKALEEYLIYGGLPEIVLSEKIKKLEIAQQYYTTVIRRDIIERLKIRNEEGLKALIRLLLNTTYYSISKLYHNLKSLNYKIGKTTLCHYLSFIENSYFLYSLPIFSTKIKNQLQYPRKIYFIDNVFLTFFSTKFSKNLGRLFENMVFIELKRRIGAETEIFYWKDQAGKEVDFVLKKGLKISQLIQTCYEIEDFETKEREIKSLIKASNELKCKNLLIITQDYEGEEKIKGKKIKFIPLWKWLL